MRLKLSEQILEKLSSLISYYDGEFRDCLAEDDFCLLLSWVQLAIIINKFHPIGFTEIRRVIAVPCLVIELDTVVVAVER